MLASPPHAETIKALRRQLSAPLAARGVLAFEDSRIDTHLPGGGLPIGQMHEISARGIEVETGAVAGGFAACLAAALSARAPPERVMLWVAQCCDVYGPGVLQYGIDPSRLILVQTRNDDETLATMETALRSGATSVVLGEVGRLPLLAARRLQLACLAEGSTALALRRCPHGCKATPAAGNAAATRWRLQPASSAQGRMVGAPCWQVELLHARGGRPGAWIMQRRTMNKDGEETNADQETHPLRVVAVLGNDAATPCTAQSRRAQG